jgi:hypothetical protein
VYLELGITKPHTEEKTNHTIPIEDVKTNVTDAQQLNNVTPPAKPNPLFKYHHDNSTDLDESDIKNNQNTITEDTTTEKKSMHFAAYLALYIGAWIAGVFVTNTISPIMGSIYSQSTFSVIIGFWIGKLIMKNRRRDWIAILCFPIFTFVAALLGHALGSALGHAFSIQSVSSINQSSLISLVTTFILSCVLFAILNTKRKVLN